MTASTDGILRGYLRDNAAGAPPEILDALSPAAVGPPAPYPNYRSSAISKAGSYGKLLRISNSPTERKCRRVLTGDHHLLTAVRAT